MKLESFRQLFVLLLSDMYGVELQIIEELPAIIKKCYSDELKEALRTHLAETKNQVKRIEKIFMMIEETPIRVEWGSSIRHLFADGDKFLKANHASSVLDAAIIVLCQRVEHFEIASYGTLREFAKELDFRSEVKDLLKETLNEEGHADALLNKLAKGGVFTSGINAEAIR